MQMLIGLKTHIATKISYFRHISKKCFLWHNNEVILMVKRRKQKKKSESIHFIGAGGIGVSALAKYFLARGVSISGSDIKETEIVNELRQLGARIKIGPHKAQNIPLGAARVIHTAAVRKEKPEYKEGKQKRLPTQSHPGA